MCDRGRYKYKAEPDLVLLPLRVVCEAKLAASFALCRGREREKAMPDLLSLLPPAVVCCKA
jgi:hypothetical protein